MITTNKINVYLHRNGEYQIDAVQGDTARVLELSLYAGAEPWAVPAGAGIQIRFKKPDGTGGSYDTLPDGSCAYEIRENTVTCALAPQVLTASGTAEVQVVLLWAAGELATFTVRVAVQADPSVGAMESEDYTNLSNWVCVQVKNYLANAQEELRELFAVPGAFFVHVGASASSATGYVADKSFAEIAEAAPSFLTGADGGRPVYCVLWASPLAARALEYQILPLSSYDPYLQRYLFTRVDASDEVLVEISAEAVRVLNWKLVREENLPAALPNPEALTINGQVYDGSQAVEVNVEGGGEAFYVQVSGTAADKTLEEIQAAYGQGVPVFCRWGDVCLPLALVTEGACVFDTAVGSMEYLIEISEAGVEIHAWQLARKTDIPEVEDGLTPYIGGNGNWWIGDEDTGVKAAGVDGNGIVSITLDEANSDETKSVYVISTTDDVSHAFTVYHGKDGDTPVKGTDYWTAADKAELVEEAVSAISSADDVPDYWRDAVDAVCAAVKSHQEAAGAQCIDFLLFSDMHVVSYQESHCEEIGRLAAAVMDRCGIPFAVMCGDTVESDSAANANQPVADLLKADEYLAPIGQERLLRVRGNHDAAWGAYSSEDTSTAYAFNLAPQKLWQYLFRSQAQDTRRVFSDDGSYFYVDARPPKARFVCLNSQWNLHSENEDGTAVHNAQKYSGFGQEQLEWLANEALDVPAGWSVVLVGHVPPIEAYQAKIRDYEPLCGILNAYANRGIYSGSYSHNADNGEGAWADVAVEVDFTAAKGEIVGWFSGHRHLDSMELSSGLPFPVVTVTCAGNYAYDTTEGTRTINTDTETALDVVTVDKNAGMIYCTRLGIGSDRCCGYRGIVTTAYTNQITISTDTDGSVYNGIGYAEGKRISASGGSISDSTAVDLTGFIPIAMGDVVRMKNVDFVWATVGSGGGLHFYSADKATKLITYNTGVYSEDGLTAGLSCEYDDSGNLVKFTVAGYGGLSDPAYLRVCASNIDGASIITVNEEIE